MHGVVIEQIEVMKSNEVEVVIHGLLPIYVEGRKHQELHNAFKLHLIS